MSEGWLNICDGVLILLTLLSPMDVISTNGCDLEGFRLLESICEVVSLILSDDEDLGTGDSLISLCSLLLLETIGVAKDTLGFSFSVEVSLISSDSSYVGIDSLSSLSFLAFSPSYYVRVRSYCSSVTFSLEF